MDAPETTHRPRRAFLVTAITVGLASGQTASNQAADDDPTQKRLPSGKLQSDAMAKSDYDQNVKDARELTGLSKSIELELEKNDQNVLSLGLLKKLDDVEKITKRMRTRMKR